MRCLVKLFLLLQICLLFVSCTVYTEKQTEVLSQSVFAAKDSIQAARIDLAETFVDEASRIVRPPKQRIQVKSWYNDVSQKKNSPSNSAATTETKQISIIPQETEKQRFVVVPESYKNDKTLVVRSAEYDELIKSKDFAEKLQGDFRILEMLKQKVDEELRQQNLYKDKMVADLNDLQKKIVEKDLSLLRRNIIIVLLSSLLSSGIYLRMKGIL
jgi:hypothetical protein